MLKDEYLDAKIRVDTEENEPSKVLSFFDFHTTKRFNFPLVFSASSPSYQLIQAFRGRAIFRV